MTEEKLRRSAADWLMPYIGIKEGSEQHKEILAVFNDSGLCTRYKMTVSDAWCAAAVSAAFIGAGLSNIFPCVECSCSKMTALAQQACIWQENDGYRPEVGDVILYDWDDTTGSSSDNTGNPDHVGIVTEISGDNFTVIEGNKSNTVGYRSMTVNGKYIRGFITPLYSSIADDAAENSAKLEAGDKVSLNGADLYASADAAKASGTKTGTYYLWDNVVTNGRIRITNSSSNVGKNGQVTGWVNVSDISGTSEATAGTGTSGSSSKPSYTVGKNYTLQVDKLNVRTGAGTNYSKVSYADLTSNAKEHAYSDGTLKKGTAVTCKAVKTVGSEIWMQIPSGWIAAYYNGKIYVN